MNFRELILLPVYDEMISAKHSIYFLDINIPKFKPKCSFIRAINRALKI
ncbi:MAG: hypothetical protein ACI8ZM_004531 [Crocinitomix sp.]|jgi:hypothetical protein